MKATKKPVEIEYYPCEPEYADKIMEWSSNERPICVLKEDKSRNNLELSIFTMEGVQKSTGNDVIIKGVENEIYPCKKSIFNKTYDY